MSAGAPGPDAPAVTRLDEADWTARQAAQVARVQAWLGPHQARAARGERHPVYDFLFHYYAFRPSGLRRWHPGAAFALAGEAAQDFLRWRGYVATAQGVWADPAAATPGVRARLRGSHDLLVTMRERPPFFGCFGLHEWAMVYRLTPAEVRHPAWPLRFPPDEIARFVESQSVCCTHFDAFRFFTPAARPRNQLALEHGTRRQHEQRGCLHANMDLYKWAGQLVPWVPSELVADCFELARDIREADMRASPYDLRALGFAPIRIETPAGRAEYEQAQRVFTARGEPLRAQLIAWGERLLAAGGD
ncbi:MAG: 3-methyladenine DNA glycosylase [Opitutales bacterium]|nr:3-methyladenine DNA glycosylase [Opitutales bacterium]